MASIDKPNIKLPLAPSYNDRGIVIDKTTDQRKVNCMYEIIKNPITGGAKLYLVKRPGTTERTQLNFGSSGQTSRLIAPRPGVTASELDQDDMWVFSTSTVATTTSQLRVSNSSATTTFLTTSHAASSDFDLAYLSRTLVSQTEFLVVQAVQFGTPYQQRWFYSSSFAAWSEVNHANFTSVPFRGKAEFMDGYAFGMDSNNRVWNSSVNALNAWGSADYRLKEIQQDVAIGLARFNNQLLAFGLETMEPFQNAGLATGSPLRRMPHLFQRVGMSMTTLNTYRSNYYAIVGQNMYFVGNQSMSRVGFARGVFAYNGSQMNKVSSPAIDKILEADANVAVWPITVLGQKGIAIEFANISLGRFLVYFPEWNDWFEWDTGAFRPVNSGEFFIGISRPQRIYAFDISTNSYLDGREIDPTTTGVNSSYTMKVQFKMPAEDNNHKQMRMFGVVGARAASSTTSPLSVSVSRDDWQTTTSVGSIDMTSAKKSLYRLGGYEDLGIILEHSANLDCRLETAIAHVVERQ